MLSGQTALQPADKQQAQPGWACSMCDGTDGQTVAPGRLQGDVLQVYRMRCMRIVHIPKLYWRSCVIV
jgi:hypothetical protein